MSAGFTPGPWFVGMWGGKPATHIVDMGKPPKAPFAMVREGRVVIHSDGDRCEVEANANLIAAAPDLYRELENCANLLFSLCPRIPHDGPRDADELREYEMFGHASSEAFRALNKARGIASEVSSVGGLK